MPDAFNLSPELLAALDRAAGYEPSNLDHVMHVLDYATRPSKAIWGGVKGGLDDTGILSGAYKGLMGESNTELADVIGLEPGRQNDDWIDWLGKEGMRMLANTAGDPLTYLFSPVKAGVGIIPRALAGMGISEGKSLASRAAARAGGDALKEYIAGSSLGRLGITHVPNTERYAGVQDIFDKVAREESLAPLQRTTTETMARYQKALEDVNKGRPTPFTDADVFHVMERPGSGPPELEAIADIVRPSQDAMDALTARVSNEAVARGLDPIEQLTSTRGRMMPHAMTEYGAGASAGYRPTRGKIGEPDLSEASRTIKSWYDLDGNLVTSGKYGHPNTKVVKRNNEYYYVGNVPGGTNIRNMNQADLEFAGAINVVPDMADLRTVKQVAPHTSWPGIMVDNPVAAIYKKSERRQQQLRYLRTLAELEDAGKIERWQPGVMAAPKGMRQLDIKGFEEYLAPKALANVLENQARTLFDPETGAGAIGQLFQSLLDTSVGRKAQDLTNYWKRLTLAHPGWLAGNAVSNIPQAFLGGVEPWRYPQLRARAAQIYHGSDPLRQEFEDRRLLEGTLYSRDDLLGNSLKGPGAVERLASRISPEVGELGGKVSETLNKYLVDSVFNVGRADEAQNKIVVALRWLEKNAPNFDTMAPADQATALDRAAREAHNALIDYDAIRENPFMKNLSLAVPFLAWQRGILGNTLRAYAEQPQHLGQLSRALDTSFIPMSKEDRSVADPWVRESSPVQGVLGSPFGLTPEGARQTLMLGRFLPHGNIEQMWSRPGEYMLSTVNPYLKALAYELPGNINFFKDRPLDEIAGSFPENIVNPVLGRPYEKAKQATFGMNLPATYDYLMRLTPWGRHINEASEAGRAMGLYNDEYKQPYGPFDFPMWLGSGGKLYPFDKQKAERNRAWEASQTEKKITRNLNYARKKGDYSGADFYQKELTDFRNNRLRSAGYVE